MTNDITGWHGVTMPRSITVIASKLDLCENSDCPNVPRRQVAKIAKRVEWLKRTRRDTTGDLLTGDNEMDAVERLGATKWRIPCPLQPSASRLPQRFVCNMMAVNEHAIDRRCWFSYQDIAWPWRTDNSDSLITSIWHEYRGIVDNWPKKYRLSRKQCCEEA